MAQGLRAERLSGHPVDEHALLADPHRRALEVDEFRLVLDGATRRRIASPIADVFGALAGREVAIVTDPPALVFDEPTIQLPMPQPDLVRVKAGERSGREGRWGGLAGLRRFTDGAFLESGWVMLDGAGTIAVPLADLERFG